VVGHRWPTAAGLDVRARAWQAMKPRLRVLHGRCTAWRRARGRRALRWWRVRRVRRVGRCAFATRRCVLSIALKRALAAAIDRYCAAFATND